jgi:two-component system cell cycle sensor histidine kinase/response regulator CckA
MIHSNTAEGRRVLLVEDDAELREAIGEALATHGLDVTAVEDGREALDRMRQVRPDVVVLDLMMPVMDGWQFRLEQRRDPELAQVPVVALSASRSASAAAVDADLFLTKPCSAATLARAVEEVLAVRQRRAEPARLAQAERMAALGTLAAGVVHEINNPLTYVLLHINQAIRMMPTLGKGADASRTQRVTELLTSALEGAERIREITRGIRTFSRVDDRPQDALDVREPLSAAIALVDHDLRHRARLTRIDRGVPYVLADEGRLAQVFLNLLTNAVQALPEGAADAHHIRVTTFTDDEGRAVVEVSDTGSGIEAHNLPHIFEPFFTTKAVGDGTGLGLSISHGIVRSLGGEMQVESALGEGTTFRVILPPATRAPTSPPVATDRPRVLLVADDPATTTAVRDALGLDHDVIVSSSAPKAIELMSTAEFDAVLCDLHMRGLHGRELFERLRTSRPRLADRIVFLAGGQVTENERAFLGARRHLDKPVGRDALRSALDDLMRDGK